MKIIHNTNKTQFMKLFDLNYLLDTIKNNNRQTVYNNIVDIFHEELSSTKTSFFLYNNSTKSFKLESHSPIEAFPNNLKYVLYLSINTPNTSYPNIITIEELRDMNILNDKINAMSEILDLISPELILLIGDTHSPVGLITLGRKTDGDLYTKEDYILINTLLDYCYMAYKNISNLITLITKKNTIAKKLDRLVLISALSKNITASETLESLIQVTLDTLNISFDVDSVAMLSYNENSDNFSALNTVNIDTSSISGPLSINHDFRNLKKGKTVVYNSAEEVRALTMGSTYALISEACTGVIVVPIYLDIPEFKLLGALCVFKINNKIISDEETILTLESISNLIAPTWQKLIEMEHIKETFTTNYRELLLQSLESEIQQTNMFPVDLYVIHISKIKAFDFTTGIVFDTLKIKADKAFIVDNQNLFILTNDKTNIDMEIDKSQFLIHTYQYKKDFHNIEEFINCVSQ